MSPKDASENHDPAGDVATALTVIRRSAARSALARTAGRDPGPAEGAAYRVLESLADGARSISEIGTDVDVDQPRASRLVAHAVREGWAERAADDADRRRRVVRLTAAGRAVLDSARQTRLAAVRAAMADWSPAERAEFARLITAFVDRWPRSAGGRTP